MENHYFILKYVSMENLRVSWKTEDSYRRLD